MLLQQARHLVRIVITILILLQDLRDAITGHVGRRSSSRPKSHAGIKEQVVLKAKVNSLYRYFEIIDDAINDDLREGDGAVGLPLLLGLLQQLCLAHEQLKLIKQLLRAGLKCLFLHFLVPLLQRLEANKYYNILDLDLQR